MAIAADRFRKARDLDGQRQIVGAKIDDDPADSRLVVADELALAAALLGAPEQVERRAAQAPQSGKHPEHAHHPGAEGDSSRLAGDWIAAGQKRWRQVKPQPV